MSRRRYKARFGTVRGACERMDRGKRGIKDVKPEVKETERKTNAKLREDAVRRRFLERKDRLIQAEIDKSKARRRGTVY